MNNIYCITYSWIWYTEHLFISQHVTTGDHILDLTSRRGRSILVCSTDRTHWGSWLGTTDTSDSIVLSDLIHVLGHCEDWVVVVAFFDRYDDCDLKHTLENLMHADTQLASAS